MSNSVANKDFILVAESATTVCQTSNVTFNGLSVGKISPNLKTNEEKKTEQGKRGNKKLTDYYPIRRTVRKCQSSVAKEKKKEIEDAIRSGKEEGLKAAVFIGKGRGVVTTRSFQRGDFVVEYSGELVDFEEAKAREQVYAVDENIGCYMYYFRHRNKQYCIDATAETKRLGRLINHSRQGNLVTKTFAIDDVPRLILIASRDIKPGEELLYDYGDRRKASIQSNPWLAT